ncbi:hypothetical protein AB0C81_18330 [Streptomyces roseoverticillatus]|uniref:hypothetical protein n=1 Tax=Streptomyces roseoverticillatus TaxID=66429 RepID=UPI0033F77F83
MWAGKIGLAIEAHPVGISAEDLATETGLSPGQIELGVLWQNIGALRWHHRFGKGDAPEVAG